MKINDQSAFINFEAHAPRPQESSVPPARVSPAQSTRPSADKVVLSPKARELQDAKTQLARMPDIDAQRVGRIKLQIENGTYKIDGGQIAERMLEEMRLNSHF
ncbi:MAG: flagellar biosynthesis anti-sigma factor FlgM [Desulfobacterales bacterium]|nr:flagellar biosynthesis anti-sigma factor FlgM [Desulfobacterales bacterium]